MNAGESDSHEPQPTPARTSDEGPALHAAGRLSETEKTLLFRGFFFFVLALLLYQILLILSLFADAIIWASSLALVFFPINQYCQRRVPERRTLAAALATSAVLLIALVPILLTGWVVLKQSSEVYPTVRGWIAHLPSIDTVSIIEMLPEIFQRPLRAIEAQLAQIELLAGFDLEAWLLDNLGIAGLRLADFGAAAAKNVVIVLLNLVLISLGMFFCFRDGERFLIWLLEVIPMPTDQARAIAARVYYTITAIIRGALLTAIVQGALAMIGYLIAGVPLAVFFGAATGIAAMIPVVGAALVWAPIGLFILTQDVGWGVFILGWGFFVVSLIDNFLKPIVIGMEARMPILLIFLAIIGGINVYGFSGIIIGPILVACLLGVLAIYRDYYTTESPARADPQDSSTS